AGGPMRNVRGMRFEANDRPNREERRSLPSFPVATGRRAFPIQPARSATTGRKNPQVRRAGLRAFETPPPGGEPHLVENVEGEPLPSPHNTRRVRGSHYSFTPCRRLHGLSSNAQSPRGRTSPTTAVARAPRRCRAATRASTLSGTTLMSSPP